MFILLRYKYGIMDSFNFMNQLESLSCVTSTEHLNRDSFGVEFNIDDPEKYPSGRVSESRVLFTDDDRFIRSGTIRMPVNQRQYTGSNDSLAEQITDNIKIGITDSILHIYLIGPPPENLDQGHEYVHLRPQKIYRLVRWLDEQEPPYIDVPKDLQQQIDQI